jgi:hypothetical protein
MIVEDNTLHDKITFKAWLSDQLDSVKDQSTQLTLDLFLLGGRFFGAQMKAIRSERAIHFEEVMILRGLFLLLCLLGVFGVFGVGHGVS